MISLDSTDQESERADTEANQPAQGQPTVQESERADTEANQPAQGQPTDQENERAGTAANQPAPRRYQGESSYRETAGHAHHSVHVIRFC